VVLTTISRVILIRDFERICRKEISLEHAGQVLRLYPGDQYFYLAFEHDRVCVATVRVLFYPLHVARTSLISPNAFYLPFLSSSSFLLQLHGLYVVNVDKSPSINSAKVVLVRPYVNPTPGPYYAITCMQLTDRRVYFTWEDARRRDDVPLYKDEGSSSYGSLSMVRPSHEAWPWLNDVQFGGCFASLML
jgi:hypothetical protein